MPSRKTKSKKIVEKTVKKKTIRRKTSTQRKVHKTLQTQRKGVVLSKTISTSQRNAEMAQRIHQVPSRQEVINEYAGYDEKSLVMVRKLGSGAYGEVFIAKDVLRGGELVAVKKVRNDLELK